jgi:hypothetical protein
VGFECAEKLMQYRMNGLPRQRGINTLIKAMLLA